MAPQGVPFSAAKQATVYSRRWPSRTGAEHSEDWRHHHHCTRVCNTVDNSCHRQEPSGLPLHWAMLSRKCNVWRGVRFRKLANIHLHHYVSFYEAHSPPAFDSGTRRELDLLTLEVGQELVGEFLSGSRHIIAQDRSIDPSSHLNAGHEVNVIRGTW